MLNEPPPSQGDLHFSLLGVPIRIHPMFWLVTLLFGYSLRDAASVLAWIIAVFLSILIHELGHALAMRAYGLRPRIILYGFGGLTGYDSGYAPYAPRSKGLDTLGQILISAAGPAAGFLLAVVLGLGVWHFGHDIHWSLYYIGPCPILPQIDLPNARIAILFNLFNNIFFITVLWGLVNLLPVYPLDGGQIAREVLLRVNSAKGIQRSLWLSIIAAIAAAAFGLRHEWWWMTMLFGYLAYSSYMTLESYRGGRSPW